ncbi:hypothetical protein D0T57_00375 [Dysgonomonas sp. 511]|nr:hypothetical protein [Dysgonomonas sp. 511]
MPFLLALPKRKQKASASFLGDLSTACRLKGINGLSPHPSDALNRNATMRQKLFCNSCLASARAISFAYGVPTRCRRRRMKWGRCYTTLLSQQMAWC